MPHDSPFRTATIHCPRCRTTELSHGELRHCVKCAGSWIPTETLAEHVSAMQADVNPKMIWTITNKRIGLPCAVCRHTMETALLFDVPVDRCHSHGVWFDKDELAEVLRRSAAHVEPKDGDPGTALMVADLAGSALDTGAIVTEVAVETAGSGILEGMLDVIGGIFSAIDL